MTDTSTAAPPVDPAELTETGEVDYFGFSSTQQVYLPGSKTQFVVIKALPEGEKKNYQNKTNRHVTIKKGTGDAEMQMRAGDERHVLLMEGIVDWHLLRRSPDLNGGQPTLVAFSKSELRMFLDVADPRVIEHIEKELRKMNPWLMAEMTLEDMIKERDNLDEMIDAKRREEEGNDASVSN
jgi:hypothetical protein